MNVESEMVAQEVDCAEAYARLVPSGFKRLAPLIEKVRDLETVLDGLARIGDKATAQAADQLKAKLAEMEPSVTMIGQVKAGKTSLVNAMVGLPGLLPADVNPWTSVVTSLHLGTDPEGPENHARFQFFNQDEWGRLVVSGGRVGELAGRAGAESEIEKVRRQIAEMQEKSRRRLGRKFELLLGQSHDYGYFDSALIERYVCLGDDFEEDNETSKTQGRFADITKSADIFMRRPELPLPLCIRDTPGVNDTFMVREQITIRSIRDSRICVVVLSAHQALSSVDMALIRLISNVKSREVIIFVNRIDELSEPARQIPEIEESIRGTLREHQGPENAEIIFGSAYWANEALENFSTGIGKDSATALHNWAEASLSREERKAGIQAVVWQLSGVPALFNAISERVAEGAGQEVTDSVARSARNLASGIKISNNIVTMRKRGGPRPRLDRGEIGGDLDQIEKNGLQVIETEFEKLFAEFSARVDRSHHSFLQRATSALINHLERYGDSNAWKYDPAGLRVLLRSAYQIFAMRSEDAAAKILAGVADDITKLYQHYQLIVDPTFVIEPPTAPRLPAPVLLGQTIALDLQTNWWSRWWRKRRGFEAYAKEFSSLIRAETAPIIDGLKREHAATIRDETVTILTAFMREQTQILMTLADQGELNDAELARFFGIASPGERQSVLENAMATLGKFAA